MENCEYNASYKYVDRVSILFLPSILNSLMRAEARHAILCSLPFSKVISIPET